MSEFIQKLFTSYKERTDGDTRIGQLNRIWYDSETNTFRIQLDDTPGGTIIGGGSGGGGDYVLPTASTTVKGGVKIDGTTITINNQVISGFSGSYTDLTNKPTIPSAYTLPTATNSTLGGVKIGSNITITDGVISVAAPFSGSYTDLTNKPTIPAAQVNSDWNASSGLAEILNKPVLFSGSYTDLTNKPTIPAAQIQSDWNQTTDTALDYIKNKPTIPDITVIEDTLAATHEPMGHVDNSQSVISFDNSNRRFTIAPATTSYVVWVKGTKFTISSSQSVTIPNNTGLYYIYFDDTGTLQYRTTFFDWPNDCMTAYVYWNSSTSSAPFVADERHGITLDWQTHEYLHRTRGAAIANGFAASNYVVLGDGSLDSHLQLDIQDGTFFDEDLQVDIVSTNTPTANTWEQDLTGPAKIPMFYLNGTGAWVIDAPTNFPIKQGTLPKYNLYSGGTWTTPDIDNNKFGVTFIIATNNINYPVIGIIGQEQRANIGDAEATQFTDLNLTGFPVVEMRPLYKLVYECKTNYANSVNARLASIFDLRSFESASSAIATYTDHGALGGLLDDDHTQYLLRTDAATVATSGSYTDLTDKPTIPSLSGYATELFVTSQGYLTSVGTITALEWTASEFFPSAPATSTVTAGDGTVDINLETGIPGSTTSVNWAFTNQGTIEFPDGTTQTSAYTGDSSTTEALTIGTGLSGTSFNGSTAVTIALEDNYGDTKNPYASKTAKYFLAAPNAANGAPTFRAIVASDIPTLNQNTTGSAATLTTARSINGVSFNGSADITVTAAAGTLTGTTLASGVTASSLTSVGTLNGLTVSKSTTGTALSITASNAAPYGGTATWQFVGNGNIGGVGSWIQFPDSSVQTTAYTGNAATVTNGVYTTDTGTVTNTMLAGSIANNKLANSSITINGSSTALGGSVTISTITGNAGTATKLATARAINGVDFDGSAAITVTAAAGTLTGSTLASGVTASSLTSVGTLTGVTSNAATAFIAGTAAESGVALQMPREGALRNLTNGANSMYFDVSNGGATHGSFQFRSSSSFTNVLTMSPTAFNVSTDAVVTARTPSFGRLAWNSAIDTELTIDDYRFRVSNQGGIYPQIISNVSGQTKNSAWTAVAAISGQAVGQAGSTGNLVPNNAWVSLYSFAAMNAAGDTVTVTLQDKNQGRIYRVTFMRSDNGATTGYNIIAERLL